MLMLRQLPLVIPMPLLTKRNRELMFWLVQVLSWSALFISHYFGTVVAQEPPDVLRTIPLISLSGFLISSPLRYVCRRLWKYRLRTMVIGSLVAAFIASVSWRLCVNLVYASLAPVSCCPTGRPISPAPSPACT